MRAITSFSKDGYEKYAHKMIESMKHWPGKLTVYYEEKPDIDCDLVNLWDVEIQPGITVGIREKLLRGVPMLDGMIPQGYYYNMDVIRFAKKVFAQYDAYKTCQERFLFWVDADCILHKDIPESFLEGLFEGNPVCYLGRKGFHSETGFVGFDLDHPQIHEFMEEYRRPYVDNSVYKMKRWHDCEVFDQARKKLGIEGNNLSPFFHPDTGLAVLERSVLGEYMVHNKGKLKYASTD